jgi:predicted enzyme related to lactoylglutathione lyase
MLTNSMVTPTIPVIDLKRSADFYENMLGLKPSETKMEEASMMFDAGGGSKLYLYQREPSPSEHTLASFKVDDIETIVDELSQNGVMFEHYDMPNGIKTDDKGIATMGNSKSAWFKDPDGNILGIIEMAMN